MKYFLTAAVIGAILNLAGLTWASVDAQRTLATSEVCLLIFVSVIYYLLILGGLEVVARIWLGDIATDLKKASVIS